MQIAPELWWVATSISNAYLWRDGDGHIHAVDPGMPGDHDTIPRAATTIGWRLDTTSSIILTHWHRDHSGAASALAEATGAAVWAGQADAAILAGQRQPTYPTLTDEERPIFEALLRAKPEAMHPPRIASIRSYFDGAAVDRHGRAVIIDVAGHTAGSIAIHLPDIDTIISGDVVIDDPVTGVRHGPFNEDDRARRRHDQLMALGCSTIAVGHGRPLSTACR